MKRRLGGIALLLVVLAIFGPAAVASSPPPAPGAWEPSSIAGCWKSTLEHHVERRAVTYSGHTFVEFRTVARVLRWCPGSGYAVVTWRSSWGPGRR